MYPKSRELVTPEISESLARLCAAAGKELPAALAAVQGWLQPVEYPSLVIERLLEAALFGSYPKQTLQRYHRAASTHTN